MKEKISAKKQRQALKMLGIGKGKYTIKPCKDFNPDCGQCRLYIIEGLLEWYYDLLVE